MERGGLTTHHQAIPDTQKVDAVLRKMEDDTWLSEGECPYEAEGEGKSDDSEDEEGSEEEVNEEEEEAAELAALVAIGGTGDTEDVRSSGYDDVEDVRSCGELRALVALPKPRHWRSRKHSSACSRRPWRPSRKWGRRDLLRSCRTK